MIWLELLWIMSLCPLINQTCFESCRVAGCFDADEDAMTSLSELEEVVFFQQ